MALSSRWLSGGVGSGVGCPAGVLVDGADFTGYAVGSCRGYSPAEDAAPYQEPIYPKTFHPLYNRVAV